MDIIKQFFISMLLLLLTATLSYAAVVERGPYLQIATPTSMVIKWRTDSATDSVVRYGTSSSNLSLSTSTVNDVTDHEVKLSGLAPATRYYYSIGDTSGALAGDASYTFVTSPIPDTDKATQIWVIGDAGTATSEQADVRDAYKNNLGSFGTDLWIMLGDNAYEDGLDWEYQDGVFDMYPELLRQAPLWSTLGNHDGHSADSGNESGPYYDIFSFPRNAEAGGIASGTEAYYSFDYGNIHFISMDSHDSDLASGGPMLTWLENDLAATSKDWIIAFWHHPPYTKGNHDSDASGTQTAMRENANPILESYGVDLVMSGHNHTYERSYLIDGHYGNSGSFNPATMIVDAGDGQESGDGVYSKPASGANNAGAVYLVAGSSGKVNEGSLGDHPAMRVGLESLGSMVLNLEGNRLDASFVNENGVIVDSFTISKGLDVIAPSILSADATSNTLVEAIFSEGLNASSAENTANYSIAGLTVSSASLESDGRTVLLNTSGMQDGVSYTLSINNVSDTADNIIKANTQIEYEYINEITISFQDGIAPNNAWFGTSDTYIDQQFPDTNYGSDNQIELDGDSTNGDDQNALIKWDLTNVPANAQVLSASITVQVSNETSNSYSLYHAQRNWQESEATWSTYSNGDNWSLAGANGNGDHSSEPLGAFSSTGTGSYTLDLNAEGIAVLQSWINGGNNYGFVISDTDSSNGLTFTSRDDSTPGDRPRLTITYAGAAATPDNEAPSAPGNLQAIINATQIGLNWSPSTDNVGVTYYQISRNGQQIGITANNSYLNSGLTPDTTYTYSVRAADAAGNLSAATQIATTTDPASNDSTAPTTPGNLRGTNATSSSVALSWEAATDNVGVTGYIIYRNFAVLRQVTTLAFIDHGLLPDSTYAYEVRAVDAAGNLSAASNSLRITTDPYASGASAGDTSASNGSSSGGGSFGSAILALLLLRLFTGLLARTRESRRGA
jgi:chitodextrinase